MSMFDKLGLASALVLLAVLLAGVAGWCMNLYALVISCVHFDPSGNWAMLLLRAVGVFVFPVGGVVGWF